MNLYAYCDNNPVTYCDLSGYTRQKNLNYFCGSSGDFNEEDWDDYLDNDSSNSHMGRQNGNTPRNNQSQNEQFEAVLNVLNINDKKRRRQLHDAISHQGMGFQEMLEFAKGFFGLE